MRVYVFTVYHSSLSSQEEVFASLASLVTGFLANIVGNVRVREMMSLLDALRQIVEVYLRQASIEKGANLLATPAAILSLLTKEHGLERWVILRMSRDISPAILPKKVVVHAV